MSTLPHLTWLNEPILVHCNIASLKQEEEPLSPHTIIYIISFTFLDGLSPQPFTRNYTMQVANKTTLYVFNWKSEWFGVMGSVREWTSF